MYQLARWCTRWNGSWCGCCVDGEVFEYLRFVECADYEGRRVIVVVLGWGRRGVDGETGVECGLRA